MGVFRDVMHGWGAHGGKQICYTDKRRDINLILMYLTVEKAMLNSKFLDEVSAKLSEAVAKSPAKDFEKNARALLAQGFSKLDLVTREEFDIQTQVLARVSQRLIELEAKVAELEAQRK